MHPFVYIKQVVVTSMRYTLLENIRSMLYILLLGLGFSQEITTEYLVENGDTIDVFSYQIPENYDFLNSHALLVAFHQWGGDENTNYYTQFDEEANNRNWIMLCPFGGSNNNYNHQGAQKMVEGTILWMMNNYSIDKNKIYMVGGSMGGAAGSIYANNHLDPTKPMVAATASASGILDCERRAIEMDGNNSMIEWFGGNWDEVPFEYHRNSAVYFADLIQSMHYNLQYTPIYLDFGETEPHRIHAEDLFNLLLNYNENIWIDEYPTGSHGYPVIDENHACEWLSQFELIDNPDIINVNLDEPARAYWLEAMNQKLPDQFIRVISSRDSSGFSISEFNNSDTLLLYLSNEYISNLSIDIEIDSSFTLGITAEWLLNLSHVELINTGSSINCVNFNGETMWFDCLEMGEYTLWFEYSSILGDINTDGQINILDIIGLVNLILYDNGNELGDVNQDGETNILDIMMVINFILRT
jgi:pimeloyl-ACP methyl ester carboxylesterase